MFPSKSGHVKPGLNQPRPWGKAKYLAVTDSERVQWWKGEKNSEKLSEIDPETVSLQTAGALFIRVTAFLLKNEPASYLMLQG